MFYIWLKLIQIYIDIVPLLLVNTKVVVSFLGWFILGKVSYNILVQSAYPFNLHREQQTDNVTSK